MHLHTFRSKTKPCLSISSLPCTIHAGTFTENTLLTPIDNRLNNWITILAIQYTSRITTPNYKHYYVLYIY